MKSTVPVGILGYGAYVPRMRVRTEEISDAWRAKGSAAPAIVEKSVASLDEDVVTMSIEAARTALDRARLEPERVGALWVGTESKPYAVKPSATVVAEALGITPRLVAADMEFACKAGSEAMQAAVAFVGSGLVEGAMAIGMDTAQARPGDALEYTAGCGGAAFLFGAAAQAFRLRACGLPPAGPEIRRAGRRDAGFLRSPDPRRAGSPPNGKCIRRIVPARARRGAGRGARRRAGLLLLVRIGRRKRCILVRDHQGRRRASERS